MPHQPVSKSCTSQSAKSDATVSSVYGGLACGVGYDWKSLAHVRTLKVGSYRSVFHGLVPPSQFPICG